MNERQIDIIIAYAKVSEVVLKKIDAQWAADAANELLCWGPIKNVKYNYKIIDKMTSFQMISEMKGIAILSEHVTDQMEPHELRKIINRFR